MIIDGWTADNISKVDMTTMIINTDPEYKVYKTVWIADECIDKIADAVVKKLKEVEDARRTE